MELVAPRIGVGAGSRAGRTGYASRRREFHGDPGQAFAVIGG